MALQIVYNLRGGGSPVAAPDDNSRFHAEGADLDEGVAVKVSASGSAGGTGKAEKATATGVDAVAITAAEADENDEVRLQWLLPGDVLKGEADSELEVGDTCQFNSDLDGFDNGTGTNILVIRTEEDNDEDHKVVYGVLKSAGLYADAP